MIVRKEIDINASLTDEQIKMIKDASEGDIVFDAECPQQTEKELAEFKRVDESSNTATGKQSVTIQLSPRALEKARSLGKGYTMILARMLEKALDDGDMIRKCL